MCVKVFSRSMWWLKVWGTAGFKAEERGEVGFRLCWLEPAAFLEIRAHQARSTPAISLNQER
jgi:hypothetical protein